MSSGTYKRCDWIVESDAGPFRVGIDFHFYDPTTPEVSFDVDFEVYCFPGQPDVHGLKLNANQVHALNDDSLKWADDKSGKTGVDDLPLLANFFVECSGSPTDDKIAKIADECRYSFIRAFYCDWFR
jgi:hypothetical protein